MGQHRATARAAMATTSLWLLQQPWWQSDKTGAAVAGWPSLMSLAFDRFGCSLPQTGRRAVAGRPMPVYGVQSHGCLPLFCVHVCSPLPDGQMKGCPSPPPCPWLSGCPAPRKRRAPGRVSAVLTSVGQQLPARLAPQPQRAASVDAGWHLGSLATCLGRLLINSTVYRSVRRPETRGGSHALK